jgi:hypothetical protein
MPAHHHNIIFPGGNTAAVALPTHIERAPLLEQSTYALRSSAWILLYESRAWVFICQRFGVFLRV